MAFVIIRFINADDFVSRAIDFVTFSLWDHTEFGTPEGTWIGAHANGGVQERSAYYCRPTREARYAIPCTDEQLVALMTWLRTKIGEEYNFSDIVGLLLRNRKLGENDHRTICSQLVIAGCSVIGKYLLNIEPEYDYEATPEMVHLSPVFIGRRTFIFPVPEV